MLIYSKEMVKSIYFSLSLPTALLESPFCSYETTSLCDVEDRPSPPKLSFPKAVDVFIPGKKWEALQFLSVLFDCDSVDFMSRHILSFNIGTQRWRISFCYRAKEKARTTLWRRMKTSLSVSPEY